MRCNKVPFATKALALKDVSQIKFDKKKFSNRVKSAKPKKGNAKLYPYDCPRCDAWHLTSKKPKDQYKAAGR
jgi:hypothetical protein